jgi:RHS repeat-associated protein
VTEHVYDTATKRLAMLKRGSEQCEWVGFVYDQVQTSYGRLSEITWGTPTACMTGRMKARFTYNGAGRVTAKYFDVTQFVITGYDQYGNPQGYDSTATVFSGYSYEGGQVKQVGYPAGWQEAALSYEYVMDALGRPMRLNQLQPPQPPVTVFGDVEYGPGGEMTRFGTETRAYNGLGQLTRITKPGAMDLEYRYSATANDGRITSQKDWVSGEEVVYQYDSLKRLIRAESVGPEWGQSFTYDGWGNMRAMSVVKGIAPVMATTADPATNRLGAWGYDANGNATSLPGATTLNLTYDAANRVLHAADGGSVDEWYAYAADNKRVWKRIGTVGVPVVTFWGIDGTRMGEFTVETRTPQGGSLMLALVRASTPPLTFAGKRIMTEDRLGSVNGSYYPYGQPKSGQTGAGERFATYYKDASGLEYAQNRYYSSTWGRFTTPDPYKASAGPRRPRSWNRYSYVLGDPVNGNDPSGLAPEGYPPSLGECIGSLPSSLPFETRLLICGGGIVDAPAPEAPNTEKGGDGGGNLSAHIALNMILRAQTAEALRTLSSRCQQALTSAGINLSDIAAIAATTEYYSTYFEGHYKVRDISGYVNPERPNQTLAQYLGSARAGTLPNALGGAANFVVLGVTFFTETTFGSSLAESQNRTLIHEALHTGTGLDDVELAEKLGFGRLPQQAASYSISSWLAGDCAPVK